MVWAVLAPPLIKAQKAVIIFFLEWFRWKC
nr:MAG TPA: hypothetical protein [Caudoviricetes sp.]